MKILKWLKCSRDAGSAYSNHIQIFDFWELLERFWKVKWGDFGVVYEEWKYSHGSMENFGNFDVKYPPFGLNSGLITSYTIILVSDDMVIFYNGLIR